MWLWEDMRIEGKLNRTRDALIDWNHQKFGNV